jgi:hypothetical protein
MELVRKLLFTIEEKYVSTALYSSDFKIDGCDAEAIAYHLSILNDAHLVSSYRAQYADNMLYSFQVGGLTWAGHELLDKIKSDTVWNKTKSTIHEKGIPFVLDTIKDIATAITTAMTTAAIQSM